MQPFSLVGVEGNAFKVMAYTVAAMRKVGYTQDDVEQYAKLAMSDDYNNLIVLSHEWIEKCNEILGLDEY